MDWAAVERLLAEAYGSPRHGNPEDPTDCLFYLMLSRKTPIAAAARAYVRLKERVMDWNRLPELSEAEIASVIYGTGLEEIRSAHLRQVAQILRTRFGAVTLEPLKEWPDDECLTFLQSLPGMGMKTALCVMLYGLNRKVFPADAHCIRILKRMGVIPDHLEHRPAQRILARLVPPELAYSLHVNLVAHGQQVCRAHSPRCELCVIRLHCAQGSAGLVAAERSAEYGTN